jgi:sarcosine oxidase, subunit gamma
MSEPLRFSDLSARDRIGFKGAESTGWLAPKLAALPSQPNRLTFVAPETIIGRLSASEYTILSLAESGGRLIEELRSDWNAQKPAGCYVAPRFHSQALYDLEGAPTFDLLATMSPVDFRARAFPAGAIAQTTCANVVAQLYCLARAPVPRVLVAVDSTYAVHLTACVADAMTEYR